jgi:hypothetical protein
MRVVRAKSEAAALCLDAVAVGPLGRWWRTREHPAQVRRGLVVALGCLSALDVVCAVRPGRSTADNG